MKTHRRKAAVASALAAALAVSTAGAAGEPKRAVAVGTTRMTEVTVVGSSGGTSQDYQGNGVVIAGQHVYVGKIAGGAAWSTTSPPSASLHGSKGDTSFSAACVPSGSVPVVTFACQATVNGHGPVPLTVVYVLVPDPLKPFSPVPCQEFSCTSYYRGAFTGS